MSAIFPAILGVGQLGLSLWASVHSYAAITRLQQYESTSETAAQYSSTAEHELHKTRTTQTSGALSIGVSIVWSLFILLYGSSISHPICACVSGAILTGLLTARSHIGNFWKPKNGVPFNLTEAYNQGIRNSKQLAHVLSYLCMVFGVQFVYYGIQVVAGLFSKN